MHDLGGNANRKGAHEDDGRPVHVDRPTEVLGWPRGFEPPTSATTTRRSDQLSYGHQEALTIARTLWRSEAETVGECRSGGPGTGLATASLPYATGDEPCGRHPGGDERNR